MTKESGQILLLTFVALGVVLFTVLFVIAGAQTYFQNAVYSIETEKATALAEAGVDKALVYLNKTGGTYNGEEETLYGDGSFSVAIGNIDESNKILQVTGYIPNKTNPKIKRTISAQASKGMGVAFVYGLQVGNGGLTLGNGSTINGSIYSNGNIIGGNNANLKGDVYVAGAGQITFDQESDCFGTNCQDFIFGKNISGENRQDIAQSFKLANGGVLNKISLKLKKVGLPANPTVRIMADDNGQPDKNNVLATGALLANLATADASFVDVTFDSIPSLGNNTYWIMAHTSLNNSNYWVWSLDLGQGYSQGLPKWSSSWQAGSWNNISGDLGFQIFLGGSASSINLGNNSIVNGNVHANTIAGNMTILKNAYYQILGSAVTVSGAKYPNSQDPAPNVFPMSDANIANWKVSAEAAGVSSGDIECVATLGPGKIAGKVSLGQNCNVKLISPVWITGTLDLGNNTKITLDQSLGAASGIIIVDGKVTLGNGIDLVGSGTVGSYLMLLSTYNSTLNNEVAIDSGNSSISGILYAPQGKVQLANGASFKEITAWQIDLGNTAELNYQSGLASAFFSSGPSGTFSLVKGTYQVK